MLLANTADRNTASGAGRFYAMIGNSKAAHGSVRKRADPATPATLSTILQSPLHRKARVPSSRNLRLRIVFLPADDLTELGKEHGVFTGLVRIIHVDELVAGRQ
jgi:hypothetical protein